LAALSKCHKLVRLDLSPICGPFQLLDLMRAVRALSCLKFFHFPRWHRASPKLDAHDKGTTETTPKWPDSLEKIYIPSRLHTSYIPAFEKPPASSTSLTVELGVETHKIRHNKLYVVFGLIGSRITTLKLDYPGYGRNQLASISIHLPNLLHLIIKWTFLPDYEISDFSLSNIDLKYDHHLRSITIEFASPEEIFSHISDPESLQSLRDLVDLDRLPDFRILRLSSKPSYQAWIPRRLSSSDSSFHDWMSSARENILPGIDIQLLEIGRCLKRRGSSASGIMESGMWLVDGEDSDATPCECTAENLGKIMSGVPI
jgi:hypothetical protein